MGDGRLWACVFARQSTRSEVRRQPKAMVGAFDSCGYEHCNKGPFGGHQNSVGIHVQSPLRWFLMKICGQVDVGCTSPPKRCRSTRVFIEFAHISFSISPVGDVISHHLLKLGCLFASFAFLAVPSNSVLFRDPFASNLQNSSGKWATWVVFRERLFNAWFPNGILKNINGPFYRNKS